MIGFGDIVRANVDRGIIKREQTGIVIDSAAALGGYRYTVHTGADYETFLDDEIELIKKYNPGAENTYDKGFEDCFNMLKHIYSLNQPEILQATGRTNISDVLNSDIYDIQDKYKKWVEEKEISPGHVVIHDGIKFLVTYVDKCSDSIEGITLADGRIIKLYKKNVTKAHGINRSEELKDLISKIKEDL